MITQLVLFAIVELLGLIVLAVAVAKHGGFPPPFPYLILAIILIVLGNAGMLLAIFVRQTRVRAGLCRKCGQTRIDGKCPQCDG